MDLASPSVSREDTATSVSLTINHAALLSIRLPFRRSRLASQSRTRRHPRGPSPTASETLAGASETDRPNPSKVNEISSSYLVSALISFYNGRMNTPLVHIDAGTFQKQLVQLAETVAQKVKREAPGLLPGVPAFVSFDLHILTRQAMHTYDLFFYLNADERREKDCYWRPAYSVVTLPLIRNMIDCLYNITSILQNPGANGRWFRMSGFKKMLDALDEDKARYSGRPEWDRWINKGRDFLAGC